MQWVNSRAVTIAFLGCLVSVSISVLGGASASAERRCFDRDHIVTVLNEKFGETQQKVEIHEEGPGVVEFFANSESGSWTILISPDWNTSCVVDTGYLPGMAPATESPA